MNFKIFLLYGALLLSLNSCSQNSNPITVQGQSWISEIEKERVQKNQEFKMPGSPLSTEDTARFKGLNYYPVNPEYRVTAKFIKLKEPRLFKMKTTTDRLPEYACFAYIEFVLAGKEYKLEVYQNLEVSKRPGYEDYLFLPFSDETNGSTTYGGGRFLDLRIPVSDQIVIDFNKAYNPYCAYNHKYSCPIPPGQNNLPVKVLAGEQNFN